MKIKLTVDHKPNDSPGSWYDSVLKLYIKGDRQQIIAVEKAIKDALKEER